METINEYQEFKQGVIDYLDEININYGDNKPGQKAGSVYFIVNGIEIIYYTVGQCMRLKSMYGESILDKLNQELSVHFDFVRYSSKNDWVDVSLKPNLENLQNLISVIEEIEFEISEEEKENYNRLLVGKLSTKTTGASFEGTIYERIKERGATIGGKFGKLVCDASGMDLFQMFAEEYYSCGEIDGVEKDPITNKPISIYECQSGIHRGEFLDESHLNKTLGKYLYDSEIIPTVKKIVLLAGGYTTEHLNIIKERSQELINRKTPIEIILLKTVREENQISIVKVEY